MRSRIRLTALAVVFALLLVPQTLLAQGLERVTPEEVGMSSERLGPPEPGARELRRRGAGWPGR